MSISDRAQVVHFLLSKSNNDVLIPGDMSAEAKHSNRYRNTISHIWPRRKDSTNAHDFVGDVSSRIQQFCGRKRLNDTDLLERISKVPPQKRMRIRYLATGVGVSTRII